MVVIDRIIKITRNTILNRNRKNRCLHLSFAQMCCRDINQYRITRIRHDFESLFHLILCPILAAPLWKVSRAQTLQRLVFLRQPCSYFAQALTHLLSKLTHPLSSVGTGSSVSIAFTCERLGSAFGLIL